MKIVIYHKYSPGFGHIHAGTSTKFIFVPDRNVLLFAECHGTFGSEQYGIVEHERKNMLLEEALSVEQHLKNGVTKMDGIINEGSQITEIHEKCKPDEEINVLIGAALEKNRLDSQISETIKRWL